jgi:hypothetical protein
VVLAAVGEDGQTRNWIRALDGVDVLRTDGGDMSRGAISTERPQANLPALAVDAQPTEHTPTNSRPAAGSGWRVVANRRGSRRIH